MRGRILASCCGFKRHRNGVTIIEMLIAMLISMLLVLSVVQGFQVIAQIITDSRAVLEMAGRLRSALHQIQADCEGITVTVDPPVTTSSAPGYFEAFEGARRDADNDANSIADFQEQGVDTSRGDTDDIVMLTTERHDEPFQGRVPRVDPVNGLYASNESANIAEVAYWLSFDDFNGNSQLDPRENFLLHRRALLIRPDLNNPTTGFVDGFSTFANPGLAFNGLLSFQQNYDVSARVASFVTPTGTTQYGISCNTLGDLTRRGSRFAHLIGPFPGINPDPSPANQSFYPIWRTNPLDLVDSSNVLQGSRLQGKYQLSGTYRGEDVLLNNVLAFDFRVFDPMASVRALPGNDLGWGVAGVNDDGVGQTDDVLEAGLGDDEAVIPGDPGWGTGQHVGNGAYVDMNYLWQGYLTPGQHMPPGTSIFAGLPVFNDAPSNGPNGVLSGFGPIPGGYGAPGVDYFAGVIPFYRGQFAYYDTYSQEYETDGFDQDNYNPNPRIGAVVDQGTDGIDNDGANGVDDPSERETSPPYPTRLRGIQIRLRVFDPDTRQVRQGSIHVDFVK